MVFGKYKLPLLLLLNSIIKSKSRNLSCAVTYCSTCIDNSSSICKICNSGYYVDNNSCSLIINCKDDVNCETCLENVKTGVNECTLCIYGNVLTNGVCISNSGSKYHFNYHMY